MRIENLNATLQKSYYGKAKIHYLDNGDIILHSYDTDVLKIENGKLVKLWNGWSATTMKHIKDFCMAFGFEYGNKSWWDNMPCENGGEKWKVEITNGFVSHIATTTFDSEEQAEIECERIMEGRPHMFAYPIMIS